MSDLPIEPTPISNSGEGIAERYVEKELAESKASLRRTQIIGGLLALFTVGYMTYLTSGFRSSLEPNGAAQIATGLASQRVDDLEPQFATYIREQVPQMIRKAPDEVISRLPEYRKSLEDRVDADLRKQSEQGAQELSKNLDEFLTTHKEQVGAMLKNGQDPAAVDAMGADLEKQFRTFLTEQKVGGETLSEKLAMTLDTLKKVSTRIHTLEENKNLTASEKSARHAIGMLMHRIKRAQAADPNAIKPLDTEAIQNAATEATARLREGMADATSGSTAPTTTPPVSTPPASSPTPASSTSSASRPTTPPASKP